MCGTLYPLTSALGSQLKWTTEKSHLLHKKRHNENQSQGRMKGYFQFMKRKIISDITISLLLYFGLVENPNKTAKEAVLVGNFEVVLERESASDVNSEY